MDYQKIKKWCAYLALVCVFVVAVIANFFDPIGYGCEDDSLRYSQIDLDEDILSYKQFLSNNAEFRFTPSKNHLYGFRLFYKLNQEGIALNSNFKISIFDKEKLLFKTNVNYKDLVDHNDLVVYTPKRLSKSHSYSIKIDGLNQKISFIETRSYLQSKDVKSSDFVIYPVYKKSLFNSQRLVFFDIGLLLVCVFIIFFFTTKHKLVCTRSFIFLSCSLFLSLVYYYNFIDKEGSNFGTFQKDSENLVVSTLLAKKYGISNDNLGIVYISDITGDAGSYGDKYRFLSNGDCVEGYSVNTPSIIVNNSHFLEEKAVPGNFIKFSNGAFFKITKFDYLTDGFRQIFLDSKYPLNKFKFGDISKIIFADSSGKLFNQYDINVYQSQYGLQGKIFSRLFDLKDVDLIHSCISLGSAFVLSGIILLSYYKYNLLFSFVNFTVFALSPWIVCFARNMYWVVPTWFLPILVGLFISLKYKNKFLLLIGYISIFFAIFVKSLCGYEYLSTIMIAMIMFLCVDAVLSVLKRDYKQFILLLKIIFFVGLISIFAFCVAICLHAMLRNGADGGVFKGLSLIYKEDVLRITASSDPEVLKSFSPILAESINSTISDIYSRYLHFDSAACNKYILFGLEFLSLKKLIALAILFLSLKVIFDKKVTFEVPFLIISFIATSSWLILARGHSYIHIHMNYVLWYFGFIQICIYIIADGMFKIHSLLFDKRALLVRLIEKIKGLAK